MIIGVIGGTGLYHLDHASAGESIAVETPYGPPSGEVFRVKFDQHDLLFLPRHGAHHSLLPSEINYRANIFALKKLGARAVISVSAVGSMREDIAPGHLVLPDQYIDRTRVRRGTFFGDGVVAHVHFADPACATLRSTIAEHSRALGITTHVGGTYLCMEGPQFSTRAESHLYRSWEIRQRPVVVIGMTAMPEAKLAREAGLCYQTVATATDYDCWKEDAEDVSLEVILQVLSKNVAASRQLIDRLAHAAFPACRSHCHELIKNSVVTPKEFWPASKRAELEILLN